MIKTSRTLSKIVRGESVSSSFCRIRRHTPPSVYHIPSSLSLVLHRVTVVYGTNYHLCHTYSISGSSTNTIEYLWCGGIVCRSSCCIINTCCTRRTMTSTQQNIKPPSLLFKGSRDRFGGVIIESQREPRDDSSFTASLTESLTSWTTEGIRGVWFHVHLQQAHWVPVLAKHGFEFHHGEGTEVVMVRWLPKDQPSALPRYAHTVVGVGAVVVWEETGQLLVVRERFHKRHHWKLPGGYVEKGEDLSVAAAREVFEETGVRAEFLCLLAARHSHAAAFSCSDLYFIVLMCPTTAAITMCTQELAACQWMKLEEYRDHPLVHETNRFFIDCYLQSRERGVSITATPLYSSIMKRNQLIYSIKHNPTSDANNCSDSEVVSAATTASSAVERDSSCFTQSNYNNSKKVDERCSNTDINNDST